jgi:hypothetical protein
MRWTGENKTINYFGQQPSGCAAVVVFFMLGSVNADSLTSYELFVAFYLNLHHCKREY